MNKHLLSFLLLFFTLQTQLLAQSDDDEGKRLELNLKDAESKYGLVPIGEDGFLVSYVDDEKVAKGVRNLVITRYGVDMKEMYRTSVNIPKGYEFVRYYVNGENVFILYAPYNLLTSVSDLFRGVSFKRFQLIKFNYESQNASQMSVDIPRKGSASFVLTDFAVAQNKVYMGGRYVKPISFLGLCFSTALCYIPLLTGLVKAQVNAFAMVLDMETEEKKMIPMVYKKGFSWVMSMDVDDSSGESYLAIKHYIKSKEADIFLRSGKDGEYGKDMRVKFKGDYDALSLKVDALNGEEKMLLGTYGSLKDRKKSVSKGIFIMKYDGNKQVFANYVTYKDLKNFTKIASKYEVKQVKKAAKKNKEAAILIQVLFHDLIDNGEDYVLLGEAYYPTYRTEVYYDAQGHMHTRTYFDGYVFMNTIVAGISKENGKVLWEQSFPLGNMRTFNLRYRVKTYHDEEGLLAMAYSDGWGVHSMVLQGESIASDKEVEKIESTKKSEKESKNYSYEGEVDYWYDNYFISYGAQNIRRAKDEKSEKSDKSKNNKGKKDPKKRQVFYVNKIEF